MDSIILTILQSFNTPLLPPLEDSLPSTFFQPFRDPLFSSFKKPFEATLIRLPFQSAFIFFPFDESHPRSLSRTNDRAVREPIKVALDRPF